MQSNPIPAMHRRPLHGAPELPIFSKRILYLILTLTRAFGGIRLPFTLQDAFESGLGDSVNSEARLCNSEARVCNSEARLCNSTWISWMHQPQIHDGGPYSSRLL
jgi:hypothetical protein